MESAIIVLDHFLSVDVKDRLVRNRADRRIVSGRIQGLTETNELHEKFIQKLLPGLVGIEPKSIRLFPDIDGTGTEYFIVFEGSG